MKPTQHPLSLSADGKLEGLLAGFTPQCLAEIARSAVRACWRSVGDELGRGVLIETWFLGRYKVSLSTEVPAGQVHELRHFSQMPAPTCGNDSICASVEHQSGCPNEPALPL